MSPELKNYYRTKQRRMAFYIAEHELHKKENPPEVSAVIGIDQQLEATYRAVRRPAVKKKTDLKGRRERLPESTISKRNGIRCPSLPTQWRNSLDVILPKAEFGHFTTKSC